MKSKSCTQMSIYIKRNEEVFGPFSIEEVTKYFADGNFVASDLAQMSGTKDWIPLGSVPGFKQSHPPPPVAPQQAKLNNHPLADSRKSEAKSKTHWPVIRDFLIVLGLQAVAVFVVGFYAGFQGQSASDNDYSLACFFGGIVGFAIGGCLATGKRWDHLFKVATLTTFAMCVLSSSFLHDSSFQRILMNAVAAFAIMGLGGAISYLFKRP